MAIRSSPRNRQSSARDQSRDIVVSRLGGATTPPPLPDLAGDDADERKKQMLLRYDEFAPYLVWQFSPKHMTLGVLARIFGEIGMSPTGQRLDEQMRQHLLNETQYGVDLCGFWLNNTRANHKRGQNIDKRTFEHLFTRMDSKVAHVFLHEFEMFQRSRTTTR